MPKTVCILSSAHPANDGRIYKKQATALARAGYRVVFINREREGTDENGIELVKVAIPSNRLRRTIWSTDIVYEAARKIQADVYHLHDPELLRAGKKLQKQAAVIYDSHEDVPRQILSKEWIPKPFRRLTAALFERSEKRISRRLSAVVVATPHIAKVFEQSGCRHVVNVNNFPRLDELGDIPSAWDAKEDCICYIGGLTRIRSITECVKAVSMTPYRFELAGTFETAALEEGVRALDGFKNVTYHGQVDRDMVKQILQRSKAGLVLLYPEPNHLLSLPTKMFEYMAAGIPVVCSDFPYLRQIIEDAHCGVTANPLDPNSIAAAIRRLLDDPEAARQMGENGRQAVCEKYCWEQEEPKLLALYRRLLGE